MGQMWTSSFARTGAPCPGTASNGMLRKSIEARRPPRDREYRSGAPQFGDALADLMAYLTKDAPPNSGDRTTGE